MKPVLVLISLFAFLSIQAQEITTSNYKEPQFTGGRKAFDNYLSRYLQYPLLELTNNENANLTAMIYISKGGKIKFVNVIGKPAFKNQTKRILTLMPDWEPAQLNGVAIDTMVTKKIYYTIGESRVKNDSTISEVLVYQVAISDAELLEHDKKRKDTEAGLQQAWDLFEKARVKFAENDLKSAIDLFTQSHQQGLKTVDLYYNLGISYLKSGDTEKACPYLAEAGRLGDEEAYKLFNKACK